MVGLPGSEVPVARFIACELRDLGQVIGSLSLHPFRHLRMVKAITSDLPPRAWMRIKGDNGRERCL